MTSRIVQGSEILFKVQTDFTSNTFVWWEPSLTEDGKEVAKEKPVSKVVDFSVFRLLTLITVRAQLLHVELYMAAGGGNRTQGTQKAEGKWCVLPVVYLKASTCAVVTPG